MIQSMEEDAMFGLSPTVWMLEHMLQDFKLDDDLVQGLLGTLDETRVLDTKNLPPKLHLWLLLRAIRHKVAKKVIDTTVLGMMEQMRSIAERAKLSGPSIEKVSPGEKLMVHVKAQAILEHIRPGGDIEKFRMLVRRLFPDPKHFKGPEKSLYAALKEVLDNGAHAERLLKTYPVKPVLHSLEEYIETCVCALKPTFLERIEQMISEKNVKAWQELGDVAQGGMKPRVAPPQALQPAEPPSPIPSPRKAFHEADKRTLPPGLAELVKNKRTKAGEKKAGESYLEDDPNNRSAARNLVELKRRRKALEEAGGQDPLENLLTKGRSKTRSTLGKQNGAQKKKWDDDITEQKLGGKRSQAKDKLDGKRGGGSGPAVGRHAEIASMSGEGEERRVKQPPEGHSAGRDMDMPMTQAQDASSSGDELPPGPQAGLNAAGERRSSLQVTNPDNSLRGLPIDLNEDLPSSKPRWEHEETTKLMKLVKTHGSRDWEKVFAAGQNFFKKNNRTPEDLQLHYTRLTRNKVNG